MYINIYTKTNKIIKNTYNGKTTTELKKFSVFDFNSV